MPKRKAIVTVINDLYSDRRVDKTCRALKEQGFEVTLIGRLLPGSPLLEKRPYQTHRLPMIFRNGVLMYLEFHIRLLIWLLSHKGTFFWSNDLDTVLPCLITAKIRNVPVIQDSHEYFTGVPELIPTPLKRKTWKALERFCYPRVDELITVNKSIAQLFEKEYKRKVHVIRNVPEKVSLPNPPGKQELGIPSDKHILLLQGAGINVQRGAEELVLAMKHLNNNVLLYIIGSGDVYGELKKLANKENLHEKVKFLGRMPYKELLEHTYIADLGFSLDKPLSINYKLSLPNKIFDYIQAQTPIIASDIPEVKHIIRKYDIGLIINNHKPETIAENIQAALQDKERYQRWQENLKFAAEKLTWKYEKEVLLGLLKKYV
ncbi:MAG: glycosyltransferase [Bacteroidales bacterium]